MQDIEKYSQEHIHFYDLEIAELLQEIWAPLTQRWDKINMVDLGCGDGRLLLAMQQRGFLHNVNKVVGVDLSPERIRRLQEVIPGVIGVISDVCEISQLKNGEFNLVTCSQVIEHVADDRLLIKEISRLLKRGGKVYISSVVKKWYGFYVYRHKGKLRLDPTHQREYTSQEEFTQLLQQNGLKVVKVVVRPIQVPLLDLVIRALIKLSLTKPTERIRWLYLRGKKMRWLRNILVPLVGYYWIEVVSEK